MENFKNCLDKVERLFGDGVEVNLFVLEDVFHSGQELRFWV